MKYLFYVLVVINLVFIVWKVGLEKRAAFLHEREDQRMVLPNLAPSPADTGISEADFPPSPPESAPTDAPTEPSDSANPRGCFEIGPVSSREQAEAFADLLEPIAREARVVTRAGDVPDGYWVIYPRASTLEAARANRQMLLDRGIYETWLFDQGPLEGAISLGLYKTPGEAGLARQALRDKGVESRVTPRLVRGDVFWVRIPWSRLPLLLDEAVQTLNSQDPALAMPSPQPCPEKPAEPAGRSPSK